MRWVLLMVLVAAGLWWWRRAQIRRWWDETVGARRAWAARAFGGRPTFGQLQRAVLAEAIRQRTVSVTGAVWLPAGLDVDLAEEDLEVIAHAPGPFLEDVAQVLTEMAASRQWRLDGGVNLRLTSSGTAPPGQPIVTVRSYASQAAGPVVAEHALPTPDGGAAATDGTAAGHPTTGGVAGASGGWPAAGAGEPVPGWPAADPGTLPPTTRAGDPLLSSTVPATELLVADAAPGGLRLEPEDGASAPIVLDGHRSAVIGRTHPADVVVDDPAVSARHCRLHGSGSSWWIEDLGSSNGTVVNGQRVAHRRELSAGDVVALGRRTRYRVRI